MTWNVMAHHFDPFRSSAKGWIYHCDADSFYVSCHMAEDASLEGKPVVVAGDAARHGVIVTASYPARALGIRTGMRVGEARALCPALIAIKPDKQLYRRYSEKMQEHFARYSEIVEPLSLDEGWLDMSGTLFLNSDPWPQARGLQADIARDMGITVSIGMSTNKMLAKQISDWSKPEGITQLVPGELPARLWPRAVSELFGCGPANADKLAAMGIHTIGDLASKSLQDILQGFGQHGLALYMRARGEDNTPVIVPKKEDRRSVSAEHTTEQDIVEAKEIGALLQQCAREVEERLQTLDMVGYRIAIKWRTADFKTHGKQVRVESALLHTADIFRAAWRLWREQEHHSPVRLLGVTVSSLASPSRQLHFWES
jgi:DNA polymerase-4